jgi:hypothetical protein
MPEEHHGPYALSQVLREELEAVRGDQQPRPPALDALAAAFPQHAAFPDDAAAEREELERRKAVYEATHALDPGLSALCLSGGGIRSASISLGVIQALADKALLREFDYLSTVSGGGYIGSWLSAWLHRTQNADDVIVGLRQERSDSDHEAPPLSHLRRYSNYLTPKLGIFSADTWTAVAIVLRNLVVNWLILIPAIALPVVVVKLLATVLISDSIGDGKAVYLAGLCLLLGSLALGYKLHRLYAPPATRDTQVSQNRFILCSLIPAVLGGLCFVWLLLRQKTPVEALGFDYRIPWLDSEHSGRPFGPVLEFAVAAFIGALAVSLIDGWRSRANGQDAVARRRYGIGVKNTGAWLAGVLVFATLIWAGAQLVGKLDDPVTFIKGLCVKSVTDCVPAAREHPIDVTFDRRLLAVIFGMPWFLLATISAHTVYLLLRSGSGTGDVEREWLGRASGWHFIAGFSWVLLSAVVLLGPELYYNADILGQNAGAWLTALATASGSVTAFLGKSGLTPAKGAASGAIGVGSNIALAIAGPLFAVLLLIMISLILDWPIAGNSQACFPPGKGAVCGAESWVFWLIGIVILLGVVDGFANVNRFSIHALYRNRLVRAFLGGGRAPHRKPDGFTDFDWHDNVRMASLWDPDRPVDKARNWRPFHVVNMTLNLAATKNLAWQQRKASSFTVTPLSCGNADLGYRPTEMYGGPVKDPIGPREKGITLGTAMAISGAAVSSNMGYHSSPSVSFLLTLFNVRLGWWLGNPGSAGEKHFPGLEPPYRREGPLFALHPLIRELLGMTSADSAYVYLSDGGHFEDLGLYEMVRRRCRWIVLCDGDQDRARGFEDLGNAVRKIWIDLGVRITFPDAPLLQAEADAKPVDIPYFALGTIHYVNEPNPELRPGKLLYIKPGVRGDEEAADVIAYKRANPDFPAQSTADQWFDEAQLEAYRRLGYLIISRITHAVGRLPEGAPADLAQLLTRLDRINPKTLGLRYVEEYTC